MENKNNPTWLLVLSSSFLSFVLLAPADAGPAKARPALSPAATLQLQEACRVTYYPEICLKTLAASLDPKVPLTDRRAVFQTALKAALRETAAATFRLNALLRNETNAFDRRCLESCKGQYSDAADEIRVAMKLTNYNLVIDRLNGCSSYIGTCGDDFGTRVNKAERINQHARKIISNAFAIAKYAWAT